MATLKEHGILFAAPMVKAILAGQKWQTRRAVKFPDGAEYDGHRPDGSEVLCSLPDEPTGARVIKAPHGPVGRRLWVRETWAAYTGGQTQDGEQWEEYDGKISDMRAEDGSCYIHDDGIVYRADGKSDPDRWLSAIHMPRWASRITLEVTRVRVERVGDITPADALAEGFADFPREPPDEDPREVGYQQCVPGALARDRFADLWGSINGAGSWASSPWVWVYDFRRVG